jgi:hypothetical protein
MSVTYSFKPQFSSKAQAYTQYQRNTRTKFAAVLHVQHNTGPTVTPSTTVSRPRSLHFGYNHNNRRSRTLEVRKNVCNECVSDLLADRSPNIVITFTVRLTSGTTDFQMVPQLPWRRRCPAHAVPSVVLNAVGSTEDRPFDDWSHQSHVYMW